MPPLLSWPRQMVCLQAENLSHWLLLLATEKDVSTDLTEKCEGFSLCHKAIREFSWLRRSSKPPRKSRIYLPFQRAGWRWEVVGGVGRERMESVGGWEQLCV